MHAQPLHAVRCLSVVVCALLMTRTTVWRCRVQSVHRGSLSLGLFLVLTARQTAAGELFAQHSPAS
jgi:hypothetical protein